jgi:predicted XRE-type DNA-binding protein
MKKIRTAHEFSKALKISPARSMEAIMKAKLIAGILQAASEARLTHEVLAKRSKIPRSAVTGILSGSLQKVSLDRVLRLVEAAGLVAEVKIKRAA